MKFRPIRVRKDKKGLFIMNGKKKVYLKFKSMKEAQKHVLGINTRLRKRKQRPKKGFVPPIHELTPSQIGTKSDLNRDLIKEQNKPQDEREVEQAIKDKVREEIAELTRPKANSTKPGLIKPELGDILKIRREVPKLTLVERKRIEPTPAPIKMTFERKTFPPIQEIINSIKSRKSSTSSANVEKAVNAELNKRESILRDYLNTLKASKVDKDEESDLVKEKKRTRRLIEQIKNFKDERNKKKRDLPFGKKTEATRMMGEIKIPDVLEVSSEQEEDTMESDVLGEGKGNLGGSTNIQLENILKNEPQFVGCYMNDEINKVPIRFPCGFILNTEESDKIGKHWTAVYCDNENVEYYDPLCNPPPFQLVKRICAKIKNFPNMCKFKYNSIKHQSDSTDTCGYHCINFLLHRFSGKDFKTSCGYHDIPKKEQEALWLKHRFSYI